MLSMETTQPLGAISMRSMPMLGGLGASQAELEAIADKLIGPFGVSTFEMAGAMRVLSLGDRQRLAEILLAKGASPNQVQEALTTASEGRTTLGQRFSPGVRLAIGVLATASMAASAYHGYKRNQSIGWALVWGFFGGLFPVITPVIAVAQGFGKRK